MLLILHGVIISLDFAPSLESVWAAITAPGEVDFFFVFCSRILQYVALGGDWGLSLRLSGQWKNALSP